MKAEDHIVHVFAAFSPPPKDHGRNQPKAPEATYIDLVRLSWLLHHLVLYLAAQSL